MNCNMCTPEETYKEAAQAVEDVLFKEDSSGRSRFGREIDKHVYGTLGRWMFYGGGVILIALAGLYWQIQDNSEAINEGGRYTQEEADVDNANLQRQIDAIAEDIDAIADYVRKN